MSQFSRITLSIITLLSALSLSLPQALAEKTMAEHWAEAGVQVGLLQRNLSIGKCYSSKADFLACFEVVKFLAHRGEGLAHVELELAQFQSSVTPASGKGVVSRESIDLSGLLDFVQNYEGQRRSLEFFDQVNELRMEEAETLLTYYDQRSARVFVDFENLIQSLWGKVKFEDNESLIAGEAFNTYLKSASDPHTYIMPAGVYKNLSQGEPRQYIGLGTDIFLIDGDIVLRPFPGSPAEMASLQEGDILTHIDNILVAGDMDKAQDQIGGNEKKQVTMSVLRDGQPRVFEIAKQPVLRNNVESRVVSDGGQDLGYIRLESFMPENSCSDLRSALVSLQNKKVEGLVLDLRGNGGGHMKQAKCIAGLFLGHRKPVVLFKNRQGQVVERHTTTSRKVTDLPLVTLIDAQSASGSEVLAGAFQYYERSWVLGNRSFGKGSWQEGKPVAGGRLVFFETVGLFYLPNNWTNQLNGITPDFDFPYTPEMTEEDMFFPRERELFINVIVDQNSRKVWEQPRRGEVAALSRCMESQGKADVNFDNRKRYPRFFDYQLSKAQDLLACN